MGGLKGPFTNTAKWSLFCSPKVNISLLFTEDLQNGKIPGENWINNGFYWGNVTGIYCVNSEGGGGRGGWGAGLYFAEEAVLRAVKYLLNLLHSSPPQRRGQGWWFALPRSSAGAIKMRPRLPLERICAQYGRCFASFVSSTASDRKGFVKGESVPLDRVLVPFTRVKGTPPRRAVPTTPLQKAPRRRQAR